MDHRTWYTARQRRLLRHCGAETSGSRKSLERRQAWSLSWLRPGERWRDRGKHKSPWRAGGTLEEPAKAGAGRRTKGAGPRVEPLGWAPSPWRPGATREHAERGRCWSPGGTAEPGGWRGTPSSARSPEPRCWGEETGCHPPCEGKPPQWWWRKRQPPCDPVEMTGTGEDPVSQLAVPWR